MRRAEGGGILALTRMIDNPDQVARLLAELRAALPLLAAMTPELAALIREQSAGRDVPQQCHVTRVDYAGDEGGIMCKLDVGGSDRKEIGDRPRLRRRCATEPPHNRGLSPISTPHLFQRRIIMVCPLFQ